jgi:hypothetical protein
MESAWILDDGLMCLGVNNCGAFAIVPYTSMDVIRFTRAEDAANCRRALLHLGATWLVEKCQPVDHAWG